VQGGTAKGSEAAGRVSLRSEQERGCDMKGDARVHLSITMMCVPPATPASKSQRVMRGDTRG